MDDHTDAFVVPRRLFTAPTRRADVSPSLFCTPAAFASFSVFGDTFESRFYGPFEAQALPLIPRASPRKRSSHWHERKKETTDLIQLLADAVDRKRMEAPTNPIEVENAHRRVSHLSVAQHEAYLKLLYKRVDAQKRGLPGVLALGPEDTKEWHDLHPDVEQEQVVYCRMLARALAAEAAAQEKHAPTFVLSWYKAMLAQTQHELYRLYPRWFEPCLSVDVPSSSVACATNDATFPANQVFCRGTCCTVDVTQLAPGHVLETDGLALDIACPRQVISEDPTATHLMETFDCDVAISSSTLVTLFDSDTSTHFASVPTGWGVPIKSRWSTDRKKKRIYLDRPVPGCTPHTREKVAEAGRAALLARFEVPWISSQLESLRDTSTGGQTVYYMWPLQDKRILVRSTIHASMIVRDGTEVPHETAKAATTPLSVFVKPDYQLLGVEEQLTTSERCRFWLHSWLRGGATVLVARLNPRTRLITSWSTPAPKLKMLSVLFAALGDVPVGTYLVRPKDAPGPSTFGPHHAGFHVLVAHEGDKNAQAVVDLHRLIPQDIDDDDKVPPPPQCPSG
ncbi:hypothetical protein PsorP6_006480 [Peronosclerospora sorghi]|uniref:Uncharacterized protein n=1 Tax=Peronosclerospora sorghi TaxID=230839 RepID=A0ACC0W562_9STRA|nr:hypothetical protein PsorP6_006480 [Peronosclerospora sorghi]